MGNVGGSCHWCGTYELKKKVSNLRVANSRIPERDELVSELRLGEAVSFDSRHIQPSPFARPVAGDISSERIYALRDRKRLRVAKVEQNAWLTLTELLHDCLPRKSEPRSNRAHRG